MRAFERHFRLLPSAGIREARPRRCRGVGDPAPAATGERCISDLTCDKTELAPKRRCAKARDGLSAYLLVCWPGLEGKPSEPVAPKMFATHDGSCVAPSQWVRALALVAGPQVGGQLKLTESAPLASESPVASDLKKIRPRQSSIENWHRWHWHDRRPCDALRPRFRTSSSKKCIRPMRVRLPVGAKVSV